MFFYCFVLGSSVSTERYFVFVLFLIGTLMFFPTNDVHTISWKPLDRSKPFFSQMISCHLDLNVFEVVASGPDWSSISFSFVTTIFVQSSQTYSRYQCGIFKIDRWYVFLFIKCTKRQSSLERGNCECKFRQNCGMFLFISLCMK